MRVKYNLTDEEKKAKTEQKQGAEVANIPPQSPTYLLSGETVSEPTPRVPDFTAGK